ncbi:uncharacterized protein LOC112588942 [Harpegnathos saltator]|uniref:uncharacterized protein LOC105191041 n=1 Tax=Harpegnathos saltator TaxID=610380 RepID=UPI000DBED3FE|nr:uncharacterized protein LOC105191041 [Harpegnathos saltator]XP_025156103.1 uncharacterized protein LOC112588942 [Harpegnathos saltator]
MAERRGRGLSSHLVQVLTGHGCFGQYLYWIQKKPTTRCHHCPVLEDTAHHKLAACEAWGQQRRVLARAVECAEEALSLLRMVQAMCGSEEAWETAAFSRDVMSRKEAAEWEPRSDTRRNDDRESGDASRV